MEREDSIGAEETTWTRRDVPVSELARDPRLQMRPEGTNPQTVRRYVAYLLAGKRPPDSTVIETDDGTLLLCDGFHRAEAALEMDVPLPVRVRSGTYRDALRIALSVNEMHGQIRSNEAKWRAVRTALADPEWGAWSNHDIATLTGTTHPFVGKVRRAMGLTRVETVSTEDLLEEMAVAKGEWDALDEDGRLKEIRQCATEEAVEALAALVPAPKEGAYERVYNAVNNQRDALRWLRTGQDPWDRTDASDDEDAEDEDAEEGAEDEDLEDGDEDSAEAQAVRLALGLLRRYLHTWPREGQGEGLDRAVLAHLERHQVVGRPPMPAAELEQLNHWPTAAAAVLAEGMSPEQRRAALVVAGAVESVTAADGWRLDGLWKERRQMPAGAVRLLKEKMAAVESAGASQKARRQALEALEKAEGPAFRAALQDLAPTKGELLDLHRDLERGKRDTERGLLREYLAIAGHAVTPCPACPDSYVFPGTNCARCWSTPAQARVKVQKEQEAARRQQEQALQQADAEQLRAALAAKGEAAPPPEEPPALHPGEVYELVMQAEDDDLEARLLRVLLPSRADSDRVNDLLVAPAESWEDLVEQLSPTEVAEALTLARALRLDARLLGMLTERTAAPAPPPTALALSGEDAGDLLDLLCALSSTVSGLSVTPHRAEMQAMARCWIDRLSEGREDVEEEGEAPAPPPLLQLMLREETPAPAGLTWKVGFRFRVQTGSPLGAMHGAWEVTRADEGSVWVTRLGKRGALTSKTTQVHRPALDAAAAYITEIPAGGVT